MDTAVWHSMAVCAVKCANCCWWPLVMSGLLALPVHCFPIKLSPSRPVTPLVSACHSLISTRPTPLTTDYTLTSHLLISNIFFQELRLDGNRLKRVPTESLRGPTSLQNLHLQDNIIGRNGRNGRNGGGVGCRHHHKSMIMLGVKPCLASAEIGKLS